jgi:hypothetical protein
MNQRSMLGCKANKDPAAFASISGRLDSIANLKHEAKALNNEQRVKTKMVSDPTNMCIQTLTGGDEHRHRMQHVWLAWPCATACGWPGPARPHVAWV